MAKFTNQNSERYERKQTNSGKRQSHRKSQKGNNSFIQTPPPQKVLEPAYRQYAGAGRWWQAGIQVGSNIWKTVQLSQRSNEAARK